MGGITRLLLLLWAGVAVSTVVDLQKRIINGKNCDKDERLYHVKLTGIDPNGFSNFCGGSLLNSQWILTAAHCWQKDRTLYAVVGVHPGPGQRVQILEEPVFYTDQAKQRHDIMLLKLPYPTNIPPVPLPRCKPRPLEINDKVQLAGHAATTACNDGTRIPDEKADLYCETMSVVSCCQSLPSAPYVYPHVICCKEKDIDVCKGDSGGGLVYDQKIYGVIVLSGTKACQGQAVSVDICNPNYANWITNTIQT